MSTLSLERSLIEARFERDREDLKQAVADLGATAKSALDPREHVRARPRTWLLAAFVLGVCLGERG